METNTDNTESSSTEKETQPPAEPMTIGRLIYKARVEKGLSLKTISQQTKIHLGLLEYLEADQFNKLPSKAYVRGFVKSAAKILSLEQDYALSLLDQAYDTNPSAKKVESNNTEIKNETARNTLSVMSTTPLETVKSVTATTSIFFAKAAVVVLIVGVVGINAKNWYEKSKEDVVVLPEVLTTTQKKDVKPKVAAKVEEPKVETPEAPIAVNIIQDKNLKSDVTIKDVTLKPISIVEKQFSEDKSVNSEKMDELFPKKYRIEPVKGTETLFLNASEGDSWLTYKVDDKEIKKFVLRQGRTLFLRGKVIRIFVGNTKSIKAFYNNQPVNLSNDKSTVKNIVVPEEMKTKFMSPLFVFQPDGSVLTSEEFIKQNQEKKAEVKTTPTTNGTTSAPASQATPAKPVAH
jgi:cytoskeleton protein RodZ